MFVFVEVRPNHIISYNFLQEHSSVIGLHLLMWQTYTRIWPLTQPGVLKFRDAKLKRHRFFSPKRSYWTKGTIFGQSKVSWIAILGKQCKMAVSIKSEPVEGGRGLNKARLYDCLHSVFLTRSRSLPLDLSTAQIKKLFYRVFGKFAACLTSEKCLYRNKVLHSHTRKKRRRHLENE